MSPSPGRRDEPQPLPGAGEPASPRPGPAGGRAASEVEPALVEAMAAGDREAFRRFYQRLSPRAYAVALAVTRSAADAEEVLVDAFHQAWAQASGYDPARAPVEAWLMNITRSRALDRVRSRLRHQRTEQAYQGAAPAFPEAVPPSPEGEALRGEERRRVHRAVAGLPPAQRRTLELAYFEGLSHSEIAGRLGEPLGTVKTRLRLAMEKIRAALASVEERGDG